jgi:hypothetical protein
VADESFRINLDAKEATAQALHLKDTIIELGDSKNIQGIIEGFISLAAPIAIAGAALYAFKAAIDLEVEGEKILQIEKSFELLANQAGVSAEAIKDGMMRAVDGTVAMSDAMAAANRAIVTLGPNADRIPQIFELARKAALTFGGDTLDKFDQLSQGIANGNMRMLKHMGIIIDNDKALRDYAKSIGTTTSALSQQGEQTARMNAVLEKGGEAFKNINQDGETVTVMLKQIGASFKEVGEAIATSVAKSGAFKGLIAYTRDFAEAAKTVTQGHFGSELQQSQYNAGLLRERLDELKAKAKEIQDEVDDPSKRPFLNRWLSTEDSFRALANKNKAVIDSEIAATEAKFKQAMGAAEKAEKESGGGEGEAPKPAGKDLQKEKEQVAKFHKELEALAASRIKAEEDMETDAVLMRATLEEEQEIMEQQYAAKIEEIHAKGQQGKELTAKQAAAMIEEIEAEKVEKIAKMNLDMEARVLKAYDNQVAQAKTIGDGIAAGFAQGGNKAKKELNDMGKLGQTVFNSMAKNSKSFFIGLGEGSKPAADLMKGFLFNSLADIAEAQGELLLLAGIGTYNPVQIAEGGALLALSGLLRSQAGGASSSSASVGGGGSSGGGGATAPGIDTGSPGSGAPSPAIQSQRNVTVQFMGDYFDSDQSRSRMVELMRQATDATGYKYEQIGVS